MVLTELKSSLGKHTTYSTNWAMVPPLWKPDSAISRKIKSSQILSQVSQISQISQISQGSKDSMVASTSAYFHKIAWVLSFLTFAPNVRKFANFGRIFASNWASPRWETHTFLNFAHWIGYRMAILRIFSSMCDHQLSQNTSLALLRSFRNFRNFLNFLNFRSFLKIAQSDSANSRSGKWKYPQRGGTIAQLVL